MATLVLSGLGSAVGGEFGALAGAMIGRSIDGALFSRARVKEDLTVQTSAYGRPIPRVYGRMRVGGTIIWATDLQVQIGSTGGKFGASGTSYSANFAVAMSSREVRRVRRIWADGKLLRGAEGDFKVPTKFRFYAGTDDQAVDPLIASVEGVNFAPAFRGLAVAVFEEFQLADFGNRIPFMTFEVEADEVAPSVGEIVSELAGEPVGSSASDHGPQGFAATGDDVETAIAGLAEAYGIEGVGTGRRRDVTIPARSVAVEELGCAAGDARRGEEVQRLTSAKLPRDFRLGYFDLDLDLQASEQKVTWSTEPGPEARLELPVALSASEAKSLAQANLGRHWRKREHRIVRLPPTYLGLRSGDRLVLPNVGEVVVDQVRVEQWAVIADCSQPESALSIELAASSGRTIPLLDVAQMPSEIELLDLPAFDEAASSAHLTMAGRGGAVPWRRLPVTLLGDMREPEEVVIEQRSIMGRTNGVLGAASPELVDRQSEITVTLADNDWLESCSLEDLLNGANLAMVGRECLQFGDVQPLGAGAFKLRTFLRGRFGTEWACGDHLTGDRFVLLRSATLKQVDVPISQVGADLLAEGHGIGDVDAPSQAAMSFKAEALRPPSPVHLSASRQPDGSLRIAWIRRSRCGYRWFDFVDAPLAEEVEGYCVSVIGDSSRIDATVASSSCVINPTELARLGSGAVTIEVVQFGQAMPSRPASLQVRI